jgi:hypothetical protein
VADSIDFKHEGSSRELERRSSLYLAEKDAKYILLKCSETKNGGRNLYFVNGSE